MEGSAPLSKRCSRQLFPKRDTRLLRSTTNNNNAQQHIHHKKKSEGNDVQVGLLRVILISLMAPRKMTVNSARQEPWTGLDRILHTKKILEAMPPGLFSDSVALVLAL